MPVSYTHLDVYKRQVLVPSQEAVQKLIAARLAADVYGVPTILLARTDAEAADLLTSDCDENDKPFCTGERTVEGFYKTKKLSLIHILTKPGKASIASTSGSALTRWSM